MSKERMKQLLKALNGLSYEEWENIKPNIDDLFRKKAAEANITLNDQEISIYLSGLAIGRQANE